jgi:hypothetical protein
MTIKRFLSFWVFAFFIVSLQATWAAGEVELILDKRITAMQPEFMLGHIGDPAWIEGFNIEGDIFVKGDETKIGSFLVKVALLEPPMNLQEMYAQSFMTTLNIIPGVGSFQVTGLGVTLGESGGGGGVVYTWSGPISNGTGSLENLYGLSAGNGVANIFAGTGRLTEVLNVRIGF